MKRSLSMFIATAMTVAGTFGAMPAASALPAAGISVAIAANSASNGDIVQAKAKKFRMRGGNRAGHSGARSSLKRYQRHVTNGGKARRYSGGHYYNGSHHYHGGYWRNGYYNHSNNFGVGVAVGALAAGAILAPAYGTSSWTAACYQKYRSFDARSGTYLGLDGYRHSCTLP